MSKHNAQTAGELLRHIGAEWIERNATNQSLITLTNTVLSEDRRHVTFFITVYPEDKEAPVLDFLNRSKDDIRKDIREKTDGRFYPQVNVVIDGGEKNRQKIDELTNK